MKYSWPLVLLAFLLPSSPLRSAEFDAKAVDAIAEKALKDFEAPGLAIAIVKDDKVLLVKGYGVRELGSGKPVTADTIFAIASCSKAFTAAAVGVLIDEKKMKWDDGIGKHLPGFHMADPFADREVTIRDALCHRTGLSRHDVLWIKSPLSREAILNRVAHLPSSTSFRTTWEYNNTMFIAAGQAAGAADGSSWESVVQKKLFDKLGMKTACFSTKTAEKLEHARPHRRDPDRKVETFPWDNIDIVGPAGSIDANVRDMSLWLRMQLNDGKLGDTSIIPSRILKEMHTPQMVVRNEGYFSIFFPPDITAYLSYGLGWFIHDFRGQHCISHGGTLEGFRAQTVLVPKHKLGIVVLTNLGGCRLPEAVSKNVVEHLLAMPSERDWNKHYLAVDKKRLDDQDKEDRKSKAERKKDTRPSLKLEDYAGKFSDLAYGEAIVTFEDTALQLKWNGFTIKLEHFHFDSFAPAPPARGVPVERATFRLDGSGKVEGLSMLGREFKKK